MAARDTRLAGSVRDRESAVNVSISCSLIANSMTRRLGAMMKLLVWIISNQESTSALQVPSNAAFMESVV
jgi:hypothetical protein